MTTTTAGIIPLLQAIATCGKSHCCHCIPGSGGRIIWLKQYLMTPALAENGDEGSSEIHFDPADYDDSGIDTSINEVALGQERPFTIAGQIINWAFGLLGIIFLVLIMYGGFLWMTARGNEEQVTKSKNILKTALIGLVIILASYGIAQFIYLYASSATMVNPG